MSKPRHDSWTSKDDRLLAKTVITYMEEGKTQLEAFREASKLLSRTPAACGYRWNAALRKQYESEIELAKEHHRIEKPVCFEREESLSALDIDKIISLLKRYKEEADSPSTQEEYRRQVEALITENKLLKERIDQYQVLLQELDSLIQAHLKR